METMKNNDYGPLFDNCKEEGGVITPIDPEKPWSINYGEVLRDKGIKKVDSHNEDWMERALNVSVSFVGILPCSDDFTGEDLRLMLESTAVGSPKHPNAYGALINTLVRRKIIVPTGEYRKMKDLSSHARKTPVYRAV
jgi:hypothetical protein